MKRIINGKKYDTETAVKIGEWRFGKCNDHDYVHEELYKKKTGEFFLYAEGGALSKYGKQSDNQHMTDASHIFPYTEKEARKWCEENVSGERYEEIFGEVDE